jgi:hypothetical protein
MFLFCFLCRNRDDMDWDLAIKRNSEALREIVAVLFALLGLDGTDAASRIPRSLHSAVLGVLRPAESAVRRLIVVAARGLVVKVTPSRPMPKGHRIGKGGASRSSFRLCDKRMVFPELRQPRVKYAKNPPRIHVFPYDTLVPIPQPAVVPPPPPDGLVSAIQAPDPQVRARRFAAPGPAYGPLAGEVGGRKSPEVQISAPSRPSARPPQEANSPNR